MWVPVWACGITVSYTHLDVYKRQALGYSLQSGIPYGTAFVKNGYVGRTFIKPGQSSRESSVRVKLNVLREAVNGKRVIMIDDSIVRGTTSDRIVKMLREAVSYTHLK